MPTTQAETLYPKATSILEDLRQLKSEISTSSSNIAGDILVGASTIPGTYLLPKYAALFKKKYPKVIFETRIQDSSQTASAIHDKRLLMAVVGSKTFSRKIEFTPLCHDKLILVASPESNLSEHMSFSELAQAPFIARETGSGTRRNMEKIFSEAGFPANHLNTIASFGSSAAIKEAVKNNLGISVVSKYAVRDELKLGWLREINLENLQMERTFYIAKLAKRSLPNQYQKFYEFLQQEASEPQL